MNTPSTHSFPSWKPPWIQAVTGTRNSSDLALLATRTNIIQKLRFHVQTRTSPHLASLKFGNFITARQFLLTMWKHSFREMQRRQKNCKSKDGKIYKAKFRLKSDGTLEYLLVRSNSKNKGWLPVSSLLPLCSVRKLVPNPEAPCQRINRFFCLLKVEVAQALQSLQHSHQ